MRGSFSIHSIRFIARSNWSLAVSSASRQLSCGLLSFAPIEHFELNGAGAVEFVDLRHEGEIKSTVWQRPIADPPDHGFAGGDPVGDPEPGVLFFLAHSLTRPLLGDIAQEQLHGR